VRREYCDWEDYCRDVPLRTVQWAGECIRRHACGARREKLWDGVAKRGQGAP